MLPAHGFALLFGGMPGAPEMIIILLIMLLVFVPTALLLGAGAVGGYLVLNSDDDEPPVDAEGLMSDIADATDGEASGEAGSEHGTDATGGGAAVEDDGEREETGEDA